MKKISPKIEICFDDKDLEFSTLNVEMIHIDSKKQKLKNVKIVKHKKKKNIDPSTKLF
jgi:uncharacterized protein YlbG (UPF0298 family)